MPTEIEANVKAIADETAPAEDEPIVAAEVVVANDTAMVEDAAVEAEVVVAAPAPPPAKKPSPKRKRPSKKKSSKSSSSSSSNGKRSAKSELELLLNKRHVEAARDARATLQETVRTLPIPVAETQVRSFGRILLEDLPGANAHSKFSSINALYPVGFSCDRYVFSPVHGRNIKMRCSILDGRSIKKKGNFAELPDGPVFRILWGRGVDESQDTSIDYPFDLEHHVLPLVDTGNAHNDSMLNETWKPRSPSQFPPKVGMRVRVKFSKDFGIGTLTKVADARTPSGKRKKKHFDVTIEYEDGFEETLTYPDPDVELLMPGTFQSSRGG